MKITIKPTCCIFVITLFFCSSIFARENDSNKGKLIAEDVADYIIEKNNFFSEHISKSSKPFKIKNYYLLFSHGFYNDNPKTSEQIWDMIRKYVEAGKMKEFYKKWVGRAAQK